MMFELEEEDLEEEYDYADEMPLDMVALATHELQDTDYDSPHVDAEVRLRFCHSVFKKHDLNLRC